MRASVLILLPVNKFFSLSLVLTFAEPINDLEMALFALSFERATCSLRFPFDPVLLNLSKFYLFSAPPGTSVAVGLL